MCLRTSTFVPCFKVIFLVSLFAFSLKPCMAGESSFDAELAWLQSEAMVFSASKSVERISKSPSTISVITARQIRAMGARDILDALRIVPGIDITRNNLWFREIEIRGIKTQTSEKIVFMLNGHELNDQVLNGGVTMVFDRLPIDNIQRIEVIRGPASALYGANAFLGIVNIITKKADAIRGVELSAQGGSYGKQHHNILAASNILDADVVINANYDSSNGYDPFVPVDAFGRSGKADMARKILNVDLDVDYAGFNFYGKFSERKDANNFGPINVLNNGSFPVQHSYFLELKYKKDISDALSIKSRIYRNSAQFNNIWESIPGGIVPGFPLGVKQRQASKSSAFGVESSVQFDISGNNRLIAGIHAEELKYYGIKFITNFALGPPPLTPLAGMTNFVVRPAVGASPKRLTWNAYVEDIWDVVDHVRLVSSFGYSHYNDYGSSLNPKVGLAWEVAQGYDVKLMYGTAFRVPTLADSFRSNINDLQLGGIAPEKVRTYELSLAAKFTPEFDADVTFFRSDITDIISTVDRVYQKLNPVKTQGAELNWKYNISEGTYIAGNYSYTKAKDVITNINLPNVANQRVNMMVNIELSDRFNVYSDIFMKGNTARVQGDPRGRVGGYSVSNMTLIAEKLSPSLKDLELRVSVYNLLNKKYTSPSPARSIPSDYLMPGINFMLEGKYKL